MSESERPRGLLSAADRAYLRGDADLGSTQAERNARARIRDRVEHALLDFEVLLDGLGARDRELVFEKRLGERDGTESFDALVSAMAFLYAGVQDTDLAFDTVLSEGVNLAEAANDRAARVTFERTYHALDADTLLRELRAGESLSLTELAFLHASDDVNREELTRLLDDEDDFDDGRIQSKVTEF
ncbi:hypothetical protein [Salarchaeum japonicum]|uniref:Domain of unknown function domain-containing protein n=1 Tax=Salarchaeum japonicum TaxID=555573 RepID=A0AAV3SY96_9EURY|nr:hypothetical protein [Salarchaeum japonicum]